MRITFLGPAALLGAVLAVSSSPAWDPDRPCCCVCPNAIYCSPVFHMPLQPAPSPMNGGYYVMTRDGRCQGPNYCLRPPFNPIQGFDPVLVGQTIFAKVLRDEFKGKNHPSQHGPGQGPPQGHGIGNYTQDFANPQQMPYFMDAMGPRPGGMPPPGFGGPGGPGPGGPQGPGGPPPETGPRSLIAQGPDRGVLRASYPGGPIVLVQNHAYISLPTPGYSMPAPNLPNPGYAMAPIGTPNTGYAMTPPSPGYGGYAPPYVPTPMAGYAAPGYGYAPPYVPMPMAGYAAPGYGYAPPYVPTPSFGYAPPYTPLPGLPGLPAVGYAPQYVSTPNLGYSNNGPALPNPSYTPNLPAVGYEPPQPPPTTACYPSHSMIRSPRDYFMFSEVMADQQARQRRPNLVP